LPNSKQQKKVLSFTSKSAIKSADSTNLIFIKIYKTEKNVKEKLLKPNFLLFF